MRSRRPSSAAAGNSLHARFLALFAAVLLGGCTASYPFIMMTDDHASKSGIVEDAAHRITYRFEASYTVGEHVASTIVLVIVNDSGKPLSLAEGRIRITSRNVDYEMNGRFIPLPDRTVPPHGSTTLTFIGTGRKPVDEPWQQIAGEQMTVDLRGLVLGGREIPGHTIRLIPVNPKL